VIRYKEFYKPLGARIAIRRRQAEMTQQQLGEALGVSQQTIFAYEQGERGVPLPLLPTIAQVLNTSVDYLFGTKAFETGREKIPAGVLLIAQDLNALAPMHRQRVCWLIKVLRSL
jgi:transcriptional regulator with XRE-family HTH domain